MYANTSFRTDNFSVGKNLVRPDRRLLNTEDSSVRNVPRTFSVQSLSTEVPRAAHNHPWVIPVDIFVHEGRLGAGRPYLSPSAMAFQDLWMITLVRITAR